MKKIISFIASALFAMSLQARITSYNVCYTKLLRHICRKIEITKTVDNCHAGLVCPSRLSVDRGPTPKYANCLVPPRCAPRHPGNAHRGQRTPDYGFGIGHQMLSPGRNNFV